MKKSEIKITVTLDDENMIQQIQWDADDKPKGEADDTRAFSLSLWDHQQKSTLRMDLWTQEMPAIEMKRMAIDVISGMAQTIASSTGDDKMSHQMEKFADQMIEYLNQNN